MFNWLLRYNTARHECDISTRQGGWHANYKQGEVMDFVTFCSTFSTQILISRQMVLQAHYTKSTIGRLVESVYGFVCRPPAINAYVMMSCLFTNWNKFHVSLFQTPTFVCICLLFYWFSHHLPKAIWYCKTQVLCVHLVWFEGTRSAQKRRCIPLSNKVSWPTLNNFWTRTPRAQFNLVTFLWLFDHNM